MQAMIERYVQECILMSDLRHPNLVQFLGVCFLSESPLPVLLMEKMDVTLDHTLETRCNIPLSMKRSILSDVSRGLQYLHNHNPPLIHRDLTARNVMLVEASMLAKISDLGNSRIVDLTARNLTQAPGTLHYSAPESLSGRGQYSAKIDVFSFGHLLLFTVTQIYPEVATATYSNAEGILVARTEIERRQDALHAMELQLEGWSHPLYQLAVCCLNNRPAARPTADVLCQELEQVRGVIQDLQENLGRLQLMDLVAQRDEEVRRQETSIAQLRSQLQQLKSSSSGVADPAPGGASLKPEARHAVPRPRPRIPRQPQARPQYAPMGLCDIPQLECYDDAISDPSCDDQPYLSPLARSRNAYTPPPPRRQLHPSTFPNRSITPPALGLSRNTHPTPLECHIGSLAPPQFSSQPPAIPSRHPLALPAPVWQRDQYASHCRPPLPVTRQGFRPQEQQVQLVPQPLCQSDAQCQPPVASQTVVQVQPFRQPTAGYQGLMCPPPQLPTDGYQATVCPPRYQAPANDAFPHPTLELQRPAMPPRSAARNPPAVQRIHPAYGFEENLSAARLPRNDLETVVHAAPPIPHTASVPAAMASLSTEWSPAGSSQGSPRSSQRSQSVDYSMYKAGHMAKNMDIGATLRELEVYAERMTQTTLKTRDDEYVAALYRPLCLEAPNTAWKVVFTVFKKGIHCGHPLSVYLASHLGPCWPTTILFKFNERKRVTLEIPTEYALQQGFQVELDSEVGPCTITKDEADTISHDFVTYPPRRVLRVRPVILPPISELDLTLDLQGVASDEDHPARKFRLTSPELSPSFDLSTIQSSLPEMGQLQQQFGIIANQQPGMPSAGSAPNQQPRVNAPGSGNLQPPPPSQPAGQNGVDGRGEDPNGVLDNEPSVADFMNKIGFEIFQKWEELGHELRLDRRIIEGVRMNTRHASTALASIREVYQAWQRSVLTDERRTWGTILRALESRQLDERRLAREVRRQLLAPPTAHDLV